MRAWIDILTPKQILFFKPVIEELQSHGFEVLATSRRYREVEPLARMYGLNLAFVGERGGKDPADQLVAATERQSKLIPVVDGFGPRVAVSVASGACARVAFGLGIRHVAVNDSPHSEVAGRLSLPLSHHLLCPWVIPYNAWAKYGLSRSQITRYRALDPVAWLKRKYRKGPIPELNPKKKTVVVRLEESYAPYMVGTDRNWNDAVLQKLIGSFPDVNILALCRYGDQLNHVKEVFGSKCIIPDEVIDGRGLLEATEIFVGMGGTMTAESALMGVPTVSAFQGSLFTEEYLRSVGLLSKAKSPVGVVNYVKRFLKDGFRKAYSGRARRIFASMEDPVPKIAKHIIANARQA